MRRLASPGPLLDRLSVIVALHAHPDDETLLTGGTLAKAAAEGHRVIVITCTDGAAGLSDARLARQPSELASLRETEVREAARILGVERWQGLGYPDSGSDPAQLAPGGFASQPVDDVARRVAEILIEERADLLISYDRHGGYGHPDHRQVHLVGARAAELAGTRQMWEATVDGRLMRRLMAVIGRVPGLRRLTPPGSATAAYLSPDEINLIVDVRDHVALKQRALAAHRSQATGSLVRTAALLVRLPGPLARRVLGREWFRVTSSR